ncbi:carbohydrate ABC transporter permease [Vallitalea okinawensis]|uniref:carbohydrate ABC transporter permease n=1 Tax=Vallitalea okinawensis TaxID=2078660 RepID=UPI001FA93F1E|nr:carbohydrate ABC transporter permease [Vallitalea okinawensis]
MRTLIMKNQHKEGLRQKSKKERAKRSNSDKIFDGVIFVILTIVLLIVAYPLYFIIISSFSDPAAVAGGNVTWRPIGFTLDGYEAVFKEENVMRGFLNSIIYTTVGVLINLGVTIPTSYALSREDFFGKKAVTIFYLITMFISGGLMPTYLVVQSLGMINTMWALVVPGALSVYNMIVARTFFKTNLPLELLESAKLDGCGNTKFFIHIALPLSGPIIAILVLFYGIGHWNSYFSGLLYIIDQEKFPLQLVLRNILINNALRQTQSILTEEALKEAERLRQVTELMKYSLIIVSSIPVMILYPFIQKHFVKGVMLGSVKG